MEEILPGIFRMQLNSTSPDTTIINVYLIPGGEDGRILMIDAGYRSPENKAVVKKELKEMGFAFDKLDIFLTHKHHDHTGLANFYHDRNARIFMNPDEDRHPYDCLYHNNTPEAMEQQAQVLRSCGVTKERTPALYQRFCDWNEEIRQAQVSMFQEINGYEYQPLAEGMEFNYGQYHFKTVKLKGHTYAQMGLYDSEHRIVFSADQMINGVVPIVGTTYIDDDLLDAYLQSVKDFPARFAGYTVYPSHFEPFTNLTEVSERILKSYHKKIESTRRILLEHPGKSSGLTGMTVVECAFLQYGIKGDYGWDSMYQTKMIITKTFSCLEYLRKHQEARIVPAQLEKDEGVLFWKPDLPRAL